MTTPLYLIASIYPEKEHIEYLRKEFKHLVSEAYKEPGCEMYDLVESKADGASESESASENTWVMMEKWSSKALWDDHMLTSHVKHINSIDKKYFRQPTELRFLHPVFPN